MNAIITSNPVTTTGIDSDHGLWYSSHLVKNEQGTGAVTHWDVGVTAGTFHTNYKITTPEFRQRIKTQNW
jgi:hypothetical protein